MIVAAVGRRLVKKIAPGFLLMLLGGKVVLRDRALGGMLGELR